MPNTTWELRTPRDLFEKARRELHRFRNAAANREGQQIDHALNFSVTAWHMCDWIYHADPAKWQPPPGSRRPRRQEEPAQDEMLRRCAELAHCRDIANGTKHFKPWTDAKIETVTANRFDYPVGLDAILDQPSRPLGETPSTVRAPKNPTPIPRLVFPDDPTKPAVDPERVFWRVLAFWKKTLKDEGLW